MNYENIIKELCSYADEKEWFEFKENWFEADRLGEYISALSNSASMCGLDNAYFVWGINDKTHEIVGTDFNPYQNYREEPLQNYLARNLKPSIRFDFGELIIENKRLIILIIPAAEDIPTSFKGKRYARIGSSKVCLDEYPKREKYLFQILTSGFPTIENIDARYQDLTFDKLFVYYESKGITLKKKTFEKNLGLISKDGKYNIMAQLLSDDCHIPIRVSHFDGETKATRLISVREFGFDCLLYSLDNILNYINIFNIPQADERNRKVERKEAMLFDADAMREAIINAFLHNKWLEYNEPMISIFSDRIEILSRGTLKSNLSMENFFDGESNPVNEKLAEIFLQLHVSEKSGRGVPKIVETYGKDAFDIRDNSIIVTIPFDRLDINLKSNKYPELNATRKKIVSEIEHNPYITRPELSNILGISEAALGKNLSYLRENGYIIRVGSNKTGYWQNLK